MDRTGIRTIAIALGASVLGAIAMLAVSQPFAVKAQEAKRYQYRVVEVLHETYTMQSMLNEYGNGGWELVAISAGDMTSPRMIFKK